MKKTGLPFLIIAIVLLFSGCANNQQTINELENKTVALEEENSSLNNEIEKLKKENSDQKEEIENLLIELDELKNGAQRLLIQIRNAYEAQQYEEVLSLAETLHTNFNGTEEDIEGQKIADLSQAEIEELNRIKKEEEDRIAAEALKSERDKAREIIRVSRVYTSSPNSANGVDLHIEWTNNSKKTVKYITFTVEPYNAVGDVVRCEIRGRSRFSGHETGPIKPGQSYGYDRLWENAWYNNTIKKAVLLEINIEYMDGTIITLKENDIAHIQY